MTLWFTGVLTEQIFDLKREIVEEAVEAAKGAIRVDELVVPNGVLMDNLVLQRLQDEHKLMGKITAEMA